MAFDINSLHRFQEAEERKQWASQQNPLWESGLMRDSSNIKVIGPVLFDEIAQMLAKSIRQRYHPDSSFDFKNERMHGLFADSQRYLQKASNEQKLQWFQEYLHTVEKSENATKQRTLESFFANYDPQAFEDYIRPYIAQAENVQAEVQTHYKDSVQDFHAFERTIELFTQNIDFPQINKNTSFREEIRKRVDETKLRTLQAHESFMRNYIEKFHVKTDSRSLENITETYFCLRTLETITSSSIGKHLNTRRGQKLNLQTDHFKFIWNHAIGEQRVTLSNLPDLFLKLSEAIKSYLTNPEAYQKALVKVESDIANFQNPYLQIFFLDLNFQHSWKTNEFLEIIKEGLMTQIKTLHPDKLGSANTPEIEKYCTQLITLLQGNFSQLIKTSEADKTLVLNAFKTMDLSHEINKTRANMKTVLHREHITKMQTAAFDNLRSKLAQIYRTVYTATTHQWEEATLTKWALPLTQYLQFEKGTPTIRSIEQADIADIFIKVRPSLFHGLDIQDPDALLERFRQWTALQLENAGLHEGSKELQETPVPSSKDIKFAGTAPYHYVLDELLEEIASTQKTLENEKPTDFRSPLRQLLFLVPLYNAAKSKSEREKRTVKEVFQEMLRQCHDVFLKNNRLTSASTFLELIRQQEFDSTTLTFHPEFQEEYGKAHPTQVVETLESYIEKALEVSADVKDFWSAHIAPLILLSTSPTKAKNEQFWSQSTLHSICNTIKNSPETLHEEASWIAWEQQLQTQYSKEISIKQYAPIRFRDFFSTLAHVSKTPDTAIAFLSSVEKIFLRVNHPQSIEERRSRQLASLFQEASTVYDDIQIQEAAYNKKTEMYTQVISSLSADTVSSTGYQSPRVYEKELPTLITEIFSLLPDEEKQQYFGNTAPETLVHYVEVTSLHRKQQQYLRRVLKTFRRYLDNETTIHKYQTTHSDLLQDIYLALDSAISNVGVHEPKSLNTILETVHDTPSKEFIQSTLQKTLAKDVGIEFMEVVPKTFNTNLSDELKGQWIDRQNKKRSGILLGTIDPERLEEFIHFLQNINPKHINTASNRSFTKTVLSTDRESLDFENLARLQHPEIFGFLHYGVKTGRYFVIADREQNKIRFAGPITKLI